MKQGLINILSRKFYQIVITSGSEVRNFFKSGTVQKPDIFFSRCRTLNTRKTIKTNSTLFSNFFQIFILFIYFIFWHQICVQGPYLMRIDNLYLVRKMFKSIRPDSVLSSRTCLANLGVRSCPVRKLIRPVWSRPNF